MTGVENSTVPRPDTLTRKHRRTVENGDKITDIQRFCCLLILQGLRVGGNVFIQFCYLPSILSLTFPWTRLALNQINRRTVENGLGGCTGQGNDWIWQENTDSKRLHFPR